MYSNYGNLYNTCHRYRGTGITDSTRFFPTTFIEVSTPCQGCGTTCKERQPLPQRSLQQSCDCSSDIKLANIFDPRHNLREVAKNCILLEDHLFQPDRRCQDCISKHFLFVDGLLDEAITLDKDMKYYDLTVRTRKQIQDAIRSYGVLKAKGMTDRDYCNLAQQIRVIRKPLCQSFACAI